MSELLEAARRLAEVNPYCDGMLGAYCLYCADSLPAHAPTCSWLSMPKIVKALEAAERLLGGENPPPEWDCNFGGHGHCWFCDNGVSCSNRDHTPDCPWQALVAALAPDA